MKIVITFLVFSAFGFIWNTIINWFLPTILSDVRNKKYDERQSKMFVEVFAKTLVWTIFSLICVILFKFMGVTNEHKNVFTLFFSNYPEIHYLIIIGGLLVIFYFHTKKKYSA